MRHVATDAFVDPPLHTRITDFLLMQADRPEDVAGAGHFGGDVDDGDPGPGLNVISR